ncbi:DUF3533 domain-containing protein [Nocardia asteroides]|uniref:YhgE/Pip domain-containing protein n=1 Tax=Nocardia asteroides TaxID=1824 RepID=UPI00341DFA1D
MSLGRWLTPIVVITVFMGVLGTMYLAYVSDPVKNLHDFPVLLVDLDTGATTPAGQQPPAGAQIVAGLQSGLDGSGIDLQIVDSATADEHLRTGKAYGAITIPAGFSTALRDYAGAAVQAREVQRPHILVQTNPRSGSFASSVVQRVSNDALQQANAVVGKQLLDAVSAQLPPAESTQSAQLSGVARTALAAPIDIVTSPYRPLPDGTGQGLSAFIFTMILLLAGFTGAMTVNSIIDSTLGYAPTEYGPMFWHHPPAETSRLRTLAIKWAVITAAAPIIAAVYLAIAHLLKMPLEHPVGLFLYSTVAIIAVGVTALSILAAVGTSGVLVCLLLFVVLGLPSSGGTVPLEASPRFFSVLADFEPMHQIYLAVRALLYFDADLSAGLAHGLIFTVIGLLIGVTLGAGTTHWYDSRGMHRTHRTTETEARTPELVS